MSAPLTLEPAPARDTVLTPEQARQVLKLKPTKWKAVRHLLPWSYAFGPRSARITYGAILDFMEQANALARAKQRRTA